MANHKSALKRIRQSEKRRLYNRAFRNRARTLVKQARTTIAGGDLQEAIARRKSRLMKQLHSLEAQQ